MGGGGGGGGGGISSLDHLIVQCTHFPKSAYSYGGKTY